jgi:hypothetical protein
LRPPPLTYDTPEREVAEDNSYYTPPRSRVGTTLLDSGAREIAQRAHSPFRSYDQHMQPNLARVAGSTRYAPIGSAGPARPEYVPMRMRGVGAALIHDPRHPNNSPHRDRPHQPLDVHHHPQPDYRVFHPPPAGAMLDEIMNRGLTAVDIHADIDRQFDLMIEEVMQVPPPRRAVSPAGVGLRYLAAERTRSHSPSRSASPLRSYTMEGLQRQVAARHEQHLCEPHPMEPWSNQIPLHMIEM